MDVKTREKERWEIEELVFDKITLLSLGRMIKKGLFEKIDYAISTGKEANVYRAKAQRGYVAVKIYRVETTRFFKRKKYIFADPRFKFRKMDERRLVYEFASKEFKNLRIAKNAKVNVPLPLFHEKNIIVMQFLGRKGLPFPKLSDYISNLEKEERERLFYEIIKDISKLNKRGLVHSDLSEYNILYDPKRKKHYFIDLGQGTVKGNPNYEKFLRRDIKNIISFFKKKGVNIDKKKVEEEFFG